MVRCGRRGLLLSGLHEIRHHVRPAQGVESLLGRELLKHVAGLCLLRQGPLNYDFFFTADECFSSCTVHLYMCTGHVIR